LMCRGVWAPARLRTISAKLKHSTMVSTVDLFRNMDVRYL
jgi:hypothetical protein